VRTGPCPRLAASLQVKGTKMRGQALVLVLLHLCIGQRCNDMPLTSSICIFLGKQDKNERTGPCPRLAASLQVNKTKIKDKMFSLFCCTFKVNRTKIKDRFFSLSCCILQVNLAKMGCHALVLVLLHLCR